MSLSDKIALACVNAIRAFRLLIIKKLTALLFKDKETYNKILINRDGAFGDSIVALPAINLIRQNFPAARIDLLSINNRGVSFKDIGLIDGFINNLYNTNKQQRKRALKTLKAENYDLFIQLPQNIGLYKSIRNMLLVRFYLGIGSGFGWDAGRIKSFMRQQKKYFDMPNETGRFLSTLKQKGIIGDRSYPLKSIPPKDQEIADLLTTTKSIAFLIGGKLQPKKWPLDHWIKLARLIGDNEKILLIGGKEDNDDAINIIANTTNTINLCGKLSINELYYVFKHCQFAISLDTGAMHLCDAAGTNLIVLFSTRDLSNKWFPNNKNTIMLEKVLPCSFCLKTKCADNICMKNISPDEVYTEYNKLLSN